MRVLRLILILILLLCFTAGCGRIYTGFNNGDSSATIVPVSKPPISGVAMVGFAAFDKFTAEQITAEVYFQGNHATIKLGFGIMFVDVQNGERSYLLTAPLYKDATGIITVEANTRTTYTILMEKN